MHQVDRAVRQRQRGRTGLEHPGPVADPAPGPLHQRRMRLDADHRRRLGARTAAGGSRRRSRRRARPRRPTAPPRAARPRSRRRGPAPRSPARRSPASSRCSGWGSAAAAVRLVNRISVSATGTTRLSTAQATTAVGSSESSRSISPPWPGSSAPMSLTPRSRLIIDSTRSPRVALIDQQRAEQHALPPGVVQQQRDAQRTGRHPGELGAGEALPGLLRADRRGHRVLAGQHPGGVPADVRGDHAEQEGERPAGAVRGDHQQRGERAEQRHVGRGEACRRRRPAGSARRRPASATAARPARCRRTRRPARAARTARTARPWPARRPAAPAAAPRCRRPGAALRPAPRCRPRWTARARRRTGAARTAATPG